MNDPGKVFNRLIDMRERKGLCIRCSPFGRAQPADPGDNWCGQCINEDSTIGYTEALALGRQT